MIRRLTFAPSGPVSPGGPGGPLKPYEERKRLTVIDCNYFARLNLI